MHIPPYYCPKCKRFKKWYQVTNVDAYDYGNCKHCGTECIETKTAFLHYLDETYGLEEKHIPPAPPTSGSNIVSPKHSHEFVLTDKITVNAGADKLYFFSCKKCGKEKMARWGTKKLHKLKGE